MADPSHHGRRVPRWLVRHETNIAGAVYGTIVVNGVVVASAGEAVSLGNATAAALTTVIVFWLAHVYSHALGRSLQQDRRLTRADLVDIAAHERSILQAAVVPLAMLVAGLAGLVEANTALWLAVISGVVVLVGLGLFYARRERLGPLATALSGSVNLAFGCAIIVLKAIVSH